MDKEYILKIIKDEVSPDQRKLFFKMVSEDRELAQKYAEAKNKYMVDSLPYTVDPSVFFSVKKPARRLWTTLTRIAAVLFIPLAAYFAYDLLRVNKDTVGNSLIFSQGTGIKYSVNYGVKGSFTLPDSSRVWLNSGSYLLIPEGFSDDNRQVFLSGEGYFSVASDESSPFLVHTPRDIMVRVTGTEFNLTCYENDPNMKLTLIEGSLELVDPKKNIINVSPDEQIVLDYESLVGEVMDDSNTAVATAWKEGNLLFENTPMDEVIRRLERWYGVHIEIDDPALLRHKFTADFESESLTQVLGLLEITTDLSYGIEGNNVRLYTNSR